MPVSLERTPDGCLLWMGAISQGKLMARRDGGLVILDRWAWEGHHGVKLPRRGHLWRACGQKRCVHPWHGAPVESLRASKPYLNGWGVTRAKAREVGRILWAMRDPRASLSGLLQGLSWDLEDMPNVSCHPEALSRLERLLGASKKELLMGWGLCMRRRRAELTKGKISRSWDLDKADRHTLSVVQSLGAQSF